MADASPGLRLKNAEVSESLAVAIFCEGFRLQAVRYVEGDPSKIPESRIHPHLLTKLRVAEVENHSPLNRLREENDTENEDIYGVSFFTSRLEPLDVRLFT